MKKFLSFRNGASRGGALIIVLAVMVGVVSPSPGCVAIGSVQIATAGSFYRVGDILDPGYGTLCAPADNYGFRLQVASVDSNGGVTAVTIVPGVGIGYSNPPSNPVRFGGSPTGTGFTANCTFN